ncbi:biotin transporter BioY [Micrococcus luteus]|uniref:biotin transporter BioY n=1 Tax=Micrococcus luteus TaxID=1270 RepID=UPI0024B22E3D|nr:biotin transporter BioY [Micrococcus luteus]
MALGLPLLSGGRGGLGVFAGPTAGFILGWIPSALIVGLIFWALTSRARPGLGAGRVALGGRRRADRRRRDGLLLRRARLRRDRRDGVRRGRPLHGPVRAR